MIIRNRSNPLGRATFRTMQVISALTAMGCQVVEAHAHLDPPVIRVDREPSGVLDSYGYISPPPGCVRVPVLCSGIRWGTRIEWISKERNQ